MKTVVLVTREEYEKGRDFFVSFDELEFQAVDPSEPALAERIRQTSARLVILGVNEYRDELYPALAGGLIARFGVGCDGIDQDLCREHNITVTNTPGVLWQSVAEHTIWLMGSLIRNIAKTDRLMRGGSFSPQTGEELACMNLLVVGFGQIGRRVARMAGAGLEMNVRAFDSALLSDVADAEGLELDELLKKYHLQAYTADLDLALGWADIVSVHLSPGEQTYHFFDEQKFADFHQGTWFINTSRGSIVDEIALYQALTSGRLAGAGLDVFENEPYRPVDPACDLRTLDNVVLTPHIASNTRASNQRMASVCIENCLNVLAEKTENLTTVF